MKKLLPLVILFSVSMNILAAPTGKFWIDATKLHAIDPSLQSLVKVCSPKYPYLVSSYKAELDSWRERNLEDRKKIQLAIYKKIKSETKTDSQYQKKLMEIEVSIASSIRTSERTIKGLPENDLDTICTNMASPHDDIEEKYPEELKMIKSYLATGR